MNAKRLRLLSRSVINHSMQDQLTPLQRKLGVALVTAEVHNRDVLSELVKEGVDDPQNFLWQAQLRCVFFTSVCRRQ